MKKNYQFRFTLDCENTEDNISKLEQSLGDLDGDATDFLIYGIGTNIYLDYFTDKVSLADEIYEKIKIYENAETGIGIKEINIVEQ